MADAWTTNKPLHWIELQMDQLHVPINDKFSIRKKEIKNKKYVRLKKC
jgi:hypothetical protein